MVSFYREAQPRTLLPRCPISFDRLLHPYDRARLVPEGSRWRSSLLLFLAARGLFRFSALEYAIHARAPNILLNRRSTTDASLDFGPGNLHDR